MSHEFNDKVQPIAADTKGDGGINLLSVNEGDRTSTQGIEATQKALEANERNIAAVMERIADIGRRAAALALTEEPFHLDVIKSLVNKHADEDEPAYVEMKKHI